MYMHPGVYIEHVPSGVLAIEAASTSVAAFVGPVRRGPPGEPVFISSASQFARLFGDLDGTAGGIRNDGAAADMFGHAVQAFFANGGAKAYIVRVAAGATDEARQVIPDPSDTSRGFTIEAVDAGLWGNAMVARLAPSDPDPATPDLSLGYTLEIGIMQDGAFVALESFTGLQMDADDPRSIESVVRDSSMLVNVTGDTLANIGAVTSDAVRGAAVTFDGTSGLVEIAGRGLIVDIGGTAVEVVFATATADVGAIAQHIQDTVRAGNTAASDFTVTVETSGANRNLLLRSGLVDTAGDVGIADPTTAGVQNARARLGLGAGATAVALPVNDLSAGGRIEAFLTGGDDGDLTPPLANYQAAFTTLRDYRDVSIVLLPGLNWIEAGDNSIVQAAITHAEFMQNRMVVVDPPDTAVVGNRLSTPKDVRDLGVSTSPYVALYYPWLEVANPHYDPDTAANLPRTFSIPPSGFAAGMWSRIDGARGVWKAPAGLEATVRSTIGPNVLIGNDLQDNLNEFGVNCLRSIIGPTVIWGARTRATKTKPEFRYVPVRRTQNMIGESLYRALQAVVFEPNDHRLWSSLRASANAFMDTLHRAGAFQGEKASEAYYVQCGLGTTMTQADIDLGVVRLVVGFAPLKPAEFVVVQIKQIVGQSA